MAGEKGRFIIRQAQDATTEAMRVMQESGELSHLHGQPLDLSDTSPDWYVHKLLKREGFAPPAIEQSKELDAAQRKAEAMVERLGKRRAWLAHPEARCTAAQAHAFNAARARTLTGYRATLEELNRAIRDHNLRAPAPLHRRGLLVDQLMAEAEHRVPPLPVVATTPLQPDEPARPRSLWRRLRARN